MENLMKIMNMSFDTLPESIVISILQYLNLQDVLNFCLVSPYIHKTLSTYETTIWKPLCGKYWLLYNLPDDCKSWKRLFITQYQQYGHCIDSYSKVKQLWNTFEKWLCENSPILLATLQHGINKEKLNSLLQKCTLNLPSDLICSYLIHDGQSFSETHDVNGIFGNIENNYIITLTDFETAMKYKQFVVNVKRIYNYNGEILPNGFSYVLMNENGEVVVWVMGKQQIVASSFLEWFSQYVNDVVSNCYPIDDGKIIPYHSTTEVSKITGCYTVTVRWLHLLNQAGRRSQVASYSYQITMSMDKHAPQSQSCKLSTRHWTVTEGEGDSKKFYSTWGNGVVGEYPVMTPGAKFSWISYNSFPSIVGSMEGHFVMKLLSDFKTEVNIDCPQFTMRPFYNGRTLPYQVVEEY